MPNSTKAFEEISFEGILLLFLEIQSSVWNLDCLKECVQTFYLGSKDGLSYTKILNFQSLSNIEFWFQSIARSAHTYLVHSLMYISMTLVVELWGPRVNWEVFLLRKSLLQKLFFYYYLTFTDWLLNLTLKVNFQSFSFFCRPVWRSEKV